VTWQMLVTEWSFDLPVVIGVLLVGALYARGLHGALTIVGARRTRRRWQAVAFYAGLCTVFVALESPLDAHVEQFFWVHMTQHVLLIMLAAPLLALGDAGVPILHGVPLAVRRPALSALAHHLVLRRLGRAFSWLNGPRQILFLFLADLYIWHWNWLFTLTLRNQVVHDCEHLCFLGFGFLFWSQVVDQRMIHTRLSYLQRSGYVILAAFSSNFLAMYFVFAPRALFAPYASIHPRPYGMSALTDQQLAGAIMWVPVMFLFGAAFVVCFFKWLGEEEAAVTPPYRVAAVPRTSDTARFP